MKQSCPARPIFNIQFNSSSVDEGESFSFTVQTTEWLGNNIYYTLSGTGITVDDLTSNQLTGQYTINRNPSFNTFTNITAIDYFTEGTETITVQLFSDAARTQLEASDTIVINDTTITPTYSIAFSSSNTDEGDSFTITVQTTPFSPGLNLYYSLTGISAEDLTGDISGSGTIDALGQMSITNTIIADMTTEGAETLTFNLFRDAAMTTQVATSSMTINDTSVAPTYNVAWNASSYNEGDTFSFTLTTANVPNTVPEQRVAFEYTGITVADVSTNNFNIFDGGSGTSITQNLQGVEGFAHLYTNSNPYNSLTLFGGETLYNDLTTEGTETLTVSIYNGTDAQWTNFQVGSPYNRDTSYLNLVASASVPIIDTSTPPALAATFRLIGTDNSTGHSLVYGRLAFNNALDTSSWNVPNSAFEIWNGPMQTASSWSGTATTTDPLYRPYDISNASQIEDGSSNSIYGVPRTNVIYFQWGANDVDDGCLGGPLGGPSGDGNDGYFIYIKPSSGSVIKDIYGQEWAGPGYSNLSGPGLRTGMQFGYTGAADYTLDMGYYELPTYWQDVYGW